MCGIAGIFAAPGVDGISVERLRAMTDCIAHRGPDDEGHFVEEASVGFGHRRLSILDLSPEGHQPMRSASDRYVIVYNGEIYNFVELRDELRALGARFRGASDTEVILAALDQWGLADTLTRLNGIFAFAVWDRRERTLCLARDHMGVKPLYYGWVGRRFVFGSELKVFRSVPEFRGEVDRDAVTLLLRYNCIPAPYSIYREVRKLPPASLLTLKHSGVEGDEVITPYWSLRAVADRGVAHPFEGSEREATDALEEVLRRAVGRQMVSDVPIGAFLSGGVDSSLVVALMQAQRSSPVSTFSIGSEDAAYNEAADASRVATHLGTNHTELIVTARDALDVIPRLPEIFDEPFADSSQIPTFLVSRLARSRVTVSLSGDGGDELFGGYNRHVMGEGLWNRLRPIPLPVRRLLAGGMRQILPQTWDRAYGVARQLAPSRLRPRKVGYNAHKLASVFASRAPLDIYRTLVSHWSAPESIVLGAHEPETVPFAPLRVPMDNVTNDMLALDAVTYLPDDILVKVDRASMAVGLEARVPLLDIDVVEFAWRIPVSLKVRDGRGKHLLRNVLYRYVPRALIDRPKSGFGVPIDAWLRGPLRDWAEALLDERRLRDEGVFSPRPVRDLWKAHLSGQVDAQYMLWDVLMFQAWHERY